MTGTVAQVSATGGPLLVVLAALALFAASLALSVLVTYRYARGYLRTGTRPLLQLAVGMFLLSVAPLVLRLGLTTAGVGTTARVLATSGSELLGLLTVLYTIYDR